jgi:hypothetical protein
MSLYRVDKREQPVALFLSDQVVHDGVVFLSPFASTHSGEETLLDLLRERDQFFPFRHTDGRFILVNKNAVTHVRYEGKREEESGMGEPIRVRITFFGGGILEGTIVLDMPEEKNRLLDYANASPGFFALEGKDAHYIANGALVREISPLR